MKVDQEHGFEQDEAVARLKALTDYWCSQYNMETKWAGNSANISGKVKGVKFSASINVEPSKLLGDIKVGFLAEKMGGRSYVEHKLKEYFDPSTSLETLQAKVA